MTHNLLNPSQKRSLWSSLYLFEKALREAAALMETNGEEQGILYRRKLPLDCEQRQAARQKINEALQEIAHLARQFVLPAVEEDAARLISSQMILSWESLIDSGINHLRGYGEVNPQAAQALDPALAHLAETAFAISRIFQGGAAEEAEKQNGENQPSSLSSSS